MAAKNTDERISRACGALICIPLACILQRKSCIHSARQCRSPKQKQKYLVLVAEVMETEGKKCCRRT